MKTKIKTTLVVLLLLVCILLLTLAACKDKGDAEPETYYTSLSAQYSPEGQYSGNLTVPGDVDDTFKDVNKDNFTLTAYSYTGEERVGVSLDDFSISKTDDKTLALTFKSPFDRHNTVSYILMSETTVTTQNKNIAAIVFTSYPEPDLNVSYEGLYQGTDEGTITATLTEGWKFAENITADMLSFPEGFDVSVEVNRESDTKVVFVITNIPANYAGLAITATLSANAIDSEFAKETALCLDYLQPNIEIDPSTVNFNSETKVFTVGKATLPEGFKGATDNGISVSNSRCSLEEWAYNEKTNSYSFKVKLNAQITESTDVNKLLSQVVVDATLKTDTEEFKYALNPYSALAGVRGDVIIDTDNDKVSIELVPYNATFKVGISAADVTVTGAGGLTNFKFSSANANKIVYTADYTAELTKGVALSFDMEGSALQTSFGLNSYSVMITVPPCIDDKSIDWAELAKKVGVSAAGSLGSAIGSSVAGFVLPHIYEFLGVDNSDPDMKAVETSINALTIAIDSLSNDIRNIRDLIKIASYRNTLDSFQTLETKLTTVSTSLLTNQAVLNYVSALDPNNRAAGLVGFKKFCEHLEFAYGSVEEAEKEWEDWSGVPLAAEAVYNIFCEKANNAQNNTEFLNSLYTEEMLGVAIGIGDIYERPRSGVINTDIVYELIKGEKPYVTGELPEIPAAVISNFEAAVAEYNLNGAYMINTIDYGNRILSNASGTSGSIIDLFFEVVNTLYNFESQTINVKKAFLARLQSTYLLNSAIILQYCDSKGDGNAAKIRSNILPVMTRIDNAFKNIAALEEREAKGNDKILVSGQLVSKTMKKETATKGSKYDTSISLDSIEYGTSRGFENISRDTYSSMIDRAKDRGLSLADDLMSAGFTNVTPDEGKKYIYMMGNAWDEINLDFFDLVGPSLKVIFGSVTFKFADFKANLVTQDGKSSPTIGESIIQVKYESQETVWKLSSKSKYHIVPNYNVLIGFAAAK